MFSYKKSFVSAAVFSGTFLVFAIGYAAYSPLPIANNGDQLTVSTWNSVVDYANKAVKQDSAILNVDSVNSRVGIGTASPNSALTISQAASNALSVNADVWYALFSGAGNGGADRLSITANAAGGWTNLLGYNNASSGYSPINYVAASHVFKIASVEKVRIDGFWNVGIGTSTPAYKLDVNGAVNATSLLVNGVAVGAGWSQWTSGAGLIYYNGNVGIGTSTPANWWGLSFSPVADLYWTLPTLNLKSSGDAGATLGLWSSSYRRSAIGYATDSGGGVLAFHTSSSLTSSTVNERMRIDSSGNIGIGTASPQNLLHLYNPTGSAIVRLESATNNANASIWFKSNVGGTISDRWEIGTNISATSSFELYDRLNWLSRMVVTNAGNVGIGTTSPWSKLSIASSAGSWEDVDGWAELHVGTRMSSTTQGEIARIAIQPYYHTGGPFNIVSRDTINSAFLDIRYGDLAQPTLFTLQHTGNVGIGTASPQNLFHISGGAGDGRMQLTNNAVGNAYADGFWIGMDSVQHYLLWREALPMTFYTNQLERMRIDASGNVGIGTTSPNSKLEISGPDTGQIRLTRSAWNVQYMDIFAGAWDTFFNSVNGWSATYPQFRFISTNNANSTTRMVIDQNGDVGIGMSPVGVKLEVNWSLRTYGNIVNQAPSYGYLALTWDLPGYANNVFPTIKTSYTNLYFSAGGSYSAYMTAGGTWNAVSDRNKKENFMPVDEKDILSRIDMLPMLKWNYKMEDASIQHIAPIAQDFYNLFHLNGSNDKMISSIDPAGVALVGIKALSSKSKEMDARVWELEKENAELKQKNSELESRLDALEQNFANLSR